jgi:hypothetical protein
MLRTTILACATALCFAASAASTTASAAPAAKAPRMPVLLGYNYAHIGTGGALVHRRGGRTRCWEAECGGGTVPIDDKYVMRGCALTPPGHPLPPHCQGIPGVPRGATRPLRR